METILAVNKKQKKFVEFNTFLNHVNVKHFVHNDEQGNMGEVFNKKHDSYVKLSYGDYISVDNEDDMYPVKKDYFQENFEVVKND